MVNTREHFPNIQKSEVVRVQTFYYSIVVLFLNSFFYLNNLFFKSYVCLKCFNVPKN